MSAANYYAISSDNGVAEPLKNLYSSALIQQLSAVLKMHDPGFDTARFTSLIFDQHWHQQELKARMHHIALALHHTLPPFKQALPILQQAAAEFEQGLAGMFFPDYVQTFGQDDVELSMNALAFFTQFSSSEFAVRSFILQSPATAMLHMQAWTKHENAHVRRLASEGCRPRLPWAAQLPVFIADPTPIFSILEELKDDESGYVRKSVSNNLNDISKDHPARVLSLCRSWLGHSKHRDAIIKHGLRTLLKQAHPEVLALFGYTPLPRMEIIDFSHTQHVPWQGELRFSCLVQSDQPFGKLRLEFAIDFLRANGKASRKVFQISESKCLARSKAIKKIFSFKPITTRQYYAGPHQLTLIINGQKVASGAFTLMPSPTSPC